MYGSYDDMWQDGAPNTIFEGRNKKVTAQREYICTACGKPILAGTQYWSHAWMDDEDGFQYEKTHKLNGFCRYDLGGSQDGA